MEVHGIILVKEVLGVFFNPQNTQANYFGVGIKL